MIESVGKTAAGIGGIPPAGDRWAGVPAMPPRAEHDTAAGDAPLELTAKRNGRNDLDHESYGGDITTYY